MKTLILTFLLLIASIEPLAKPTQRYQPQPRMASIIIMLD